MFNSVYRLALFSLPMIASGLMNMLSTVIAMWFVSRLGSHALAAGALAVPTFLALSTIVTTLFYSVGILIGHRKNQENAKDEVGSLLRNGFFLALLMSLPAMAVLFNADTILLFFKQDPQLVKITKNYFFYAALSMPASLIGMVVSQFFNGIGKPRFTFWILLISLPFSLFLSYGFILGKYHFPALGLAGVTCAIGLTQTTASIFLIGYLFFSSYSKKYTIFSQKNCFDLKECKTIFMLGFPIGIQFGAELAAMTGVTYLMGYFGVTALAASQMVSQYAMLVIMVILGLSQALSIKISEAYSNHNIVLIKQEMLSAIILLNVFFVGIVSAFYLFPSLLLSLFVDIHDPRHFTVVHLATLFFRVSAIMLLVDGVRNLFSSALRGLHDSKTPMRMGVFCLWLISLPMAYVSGFLLNGGPVGLRIGFISGFLVAAIFLWWRFEKLTR